ncbi:hypothetical protein ACOSP7_011249 [Xanthoceras sorbifolium]
MTNLKRVFEMARTWRSKASTASRRRRSRRQISLPRNATTSVAQKGHFVVYSIDKKRFEVPLQYLNHDIFIELLEMSKEEFGLQASGPIMLPCDAAFMELAMSSLVQQQKASQKCSSMSSFNNRHDQESSQQQMLLVPGF